MLLWCEVGNVDVAVVVVVANITVAVVLAVFAVQTRYYSLR